MRRKRGDPREERTEESGTGTETEKSVDEEKTTSIEEPIVLDKEARDGIEGSKFTNENVVPDDTLCDVSYKGLFVVHGSSFMNILEIFSFCDC